MTQQGSSNRLIYDQCAYEKQLGESVSPYAYRTYGGAYENGQKCKQDKFWKRNDADVVDVESDLKNITRPATKCPSLKYDPKCKKSGQCISTFDPSLPVILDYNVCPVVFNNIPRMTTNGINAPEQPHFLRNK
jgi:hypothetical protein